MTPKTQRTLYWVTTVLFGLFMLMAGVVEAIQHESGKAIMDQLGYGYFNLTVLGIGKILGALVLLLPPKKFPILKEWAYAGFVFTFAGALVARIVVFDSVGNVISPILFTTFLLFNYWLWKKVR